MRQWLTRRAVMNAREREPRSGVVLSEWTPVRAQITRKVNARGVNAHLLTCREPSGREPRAAEHSTRTLHVGRPNALWNNNGVEWQAHRLENKTLRRFRCVSVKWKRLRFSHERDVLKIESLCTYWSGCCFAFARRDMYHVREGM